MPAVSSTTITYSAIQNGDGGSTSSRPGERGPAEGALADRRTVAPPSRSFSRKLVCDAATVDYSLAFRLTSVRRPYGRTKSRSLVLSREESSFAHTLCPKSYANDRK